MNPLILYQDEDLIVLDKPPGMVVNRATTVKTETVEEWIESLRQLHPLPSENKTNVESFPEDTVLEFTKRAGIVHRIDKETSGILLVANSVRAFANLQDQFKMRHVKKTYLAFVHGVVPDDGEINVPIGRLPWNREQFGVVPGGKESKTVFKKISDQLNVHDKTQTFSVVEVYPETGRTHQIRVHFKYIGHPLLGDYLYAGRKQSRDDRKEIPRVMLHAWKISFTHPTTGKPLAFEAPIPDDMKSIINS